MTSLNDINDLLINQFGPFGPLLAVGLLGLFMILLAIPLLLNQPEDPMKKLQRSMSESTRDKKPQKERLRQADRNEQLQKFASFLEPQNADELSAMELKLRQAGYQSKDSVRLFHFAQFALGLVGLVAGLVYVYVLNADMEYDSQQMIIRIIGPGAAAYMLPKYWITRRIDIARHWKQTHPYQPAKD